MRLVFMGSAEGACQSLERLLASKADAVAGIVTQPDRAKGRSLIMTRCPVRALAGDSGIPVLTPERLIGEGVAAALAELAPDLIVVVAYGNMLPPDIMAIPRSGCINVHFSLLPKFRGAAPVEWAIARGERMAGVTTMLMNEQMDAGDIILQASEPIRNDDTAGSVHERLAIIGADLLLRTLDLARSGRMTTTPQNHSEATFAPKLRKEDGRLDWTRPALELHNRIRGFNPRPGCFLERSSGARLRVFGSRVEQPSIPSAARGEEGAGIVLETSGAGPLVSTGEKAIRLLEVQPEGRKIMSGSSYLCGHPMKIGEHLF